MSGNLEIRICLRFEFQGIFTFKNGPSLKQLRKQKTSQVISQENDSQEWYQNFKTLWNEVEGKIEVKHHEKIVKFR